MLKNLVAQFIFPYGSLDAFWGGDCGIDPGRTRGHPGYALLVAVKSERIHAGGILTWTTNPSIAELLLDGHTCGQVLAKFAFEAQGRDSPDLVRAMSGLALGLGRASTAAP